MYTQDISWMCALSYGAKMEELEGARAGAEKRMQELSTRLQENEYQNEEGRKKEVQVSHHISGCTIYWKLVI